MTFRAVCTDCSWSVEDERFEPVTDGLERHARKEQHHVEFIRSIDAPV